MLPRTRAEDKQFRKRFREDIQVRSRRILVLQDKRRKYDRADVYYTTSH
jgi:hypothetical protein